MSHSDSLAGDIGKVIHNWNSHDTNEQQHILKGCFEGAAGMAQILAGDQAGGSKMLGKAVDDMFTQGHLDFDEIDQVMHTINHASRI